MNECCQETLRSFVEEVIAHVLKLRGFYEKEFAKQEGVARISMLAQMRSSSSRTIGILGRCLPVVCSRELREELNDKIRAACEQIDMPPLADVVGE